jgi:hypothetical protein
MTSWHFSGENTTRRSGGFLRSLIIAKVMGIWYVFCSVSYRNNCGGKDRVFHVSLLPV